MNVAPPPVIPALVTFLGAALSVPVSSVVPNPRPPAFVRLGATGGQRRNLSQADPTVLVECWAASSYQAMELASSAWSALEGADWLSPEVWVAESRASLPVDFPDPTSEQARWQFLWSPTVNLKETP